MSEPIDLGAIYDFFTNDAGGARFQASVIAQVFYFPIIYQLNLQQNFLILTLMLLRAKCAQIFQTAISP